MSTLISGFFTTEKLKEILKVVEAKKEKGFTFTCSISDDGNKYGQNVSFYAEQSKEDREAKKAKYYFGNGKVFWTDGKVTLAPKKEEITKPSVPTSTSDLPF